MHFGRVPENGLLDYRTILAMFAMLLPGCTTRLHKTSQMASALLSLLMARNPAGHRAVPHQALKVGQLTLSGIDRHLEHVIDLWASAQNITDPSHWNYYVT